MVSHLCVRLLQIELELPDWLEDDELFQSPASTSTAPVTTDIMAEAMLTASITGSCPVPTCNYNGSSIRRHWTAVHTDVVLTHQCVVERCLFEHVRVDKVRQHAVNAHYDAFCSQEDRVAQLSKLCQVLRPNPAFIDPAGVTPPIGLVYPRANTRQKIPTMHSSRISGAPAWASMKVPEELPTDPKAALKEYQLLHNIILRLQKRA